jgi:hypothetical protein
MVDTMTPRRFPAPWSAEKIAGDYVVREANGTGARRHLHPRDRIRRDAGHGADPGRGAPDRGQYRKAAGTVDAARMTARGAAQFTTSAITNCPAWLRR